MDNDFLIKLIQSMPKLINDVIITKERYTRW